MKKEYLFEIWKDIKGYEGYYQVSNYGRVKSLDRYVEYNTGYMYFKKGKIINLPKYSNGYYFVCLSKDNVQKQIMVHRLVAQAFIPNPHNYPCVNHKDENKQNNFVWVNEDGTVDLEKSNLEWCTHQYNDNYGSRPKRLSEKLINNNKLSKRIQQYTLEGLFIKEYPSGMDIKRKLGFDSTCISRVCNGYREQAYGYIWKYVT